MTKHVPAAAAARRPTFSGIDCQRRPPRPARARLLISFARHKMRFHLYVEVSATPLILRLKYRETFSPTLLGCGAPRKPYRRAVCVGEGLTELSASQDPVCTLHIEKSRPTDRTLHCTRHRFATALFARRFDARVRPPAVAFAGRLMKQNAGGDI
ncbi:hypothetical protein EVAR_67784_1 [Eumeta japonica]|uniref:Uncharacterized protein n=1 Tax=Eumeta variegata TaxID=151549 RepID=A0A4C1ZUA2_EUMVA|nr:hypothetical protein EVAR_67784_1 [Eumeta japonica]